ncbi:hypothetical protein DUI87_07227 [Hirundo rustica rustica]|uniref:Uncharacterized protein n=1 Tax=Hirundo rustica rustica TaxID=333673 RepID=A0A3M0L755_HIRRU|nr:hypothetical protein DUI87_07227 [Hirundo rustica rustica]
MADRARRRGLGGVWEDGQPCLSLHNDLDLVQYSDMNIDLILMTITDFNGFELRKSRLDKEEIIFCEDVSVLGKQDIINGRVKKRTAEERLKMCLEEKEVDESSKLSAEIGSNAGLMAELGLKGFFQHKQFSDSGMENVEVSNASFAPVFFTNKCSSHIAQVTESKSRNQENEEPHAGGEEEVQDHVRNMKRHKSMRPDEMHLWDLREFSEELLSHYP